MVPSEKQRAGYELVGVNNHDTHQKKTPVALTGNGGNHKTSSKIYHFLYAARGG
jgi:hypothetical protein